MNRDFAVKSKNNGTFKLSPTGTIVFSFIAIIVLGTLLLSLPIATRSKTPTPFIDVLFTATSATCVTGLVVKDTATHWSLFGQLVILTLIQTGGLGLITITTFFSTLMRKRVGLKSMMLAQESINHFSIQEAVKLIQKVVYVVFAIELAGALILSSVFVPKFGLKGFYYGIFHSVSAFCNAGFDIMGNFKSFSSYNDNPVIILTICILVIIGGLGYIVWKDLFEYKKNKTLFLHTKVVLILSSSLLLIGFIFFFFAEYNNPGTLGNFPFIEKVYASLFHSVNTRTAGFSTLNLNNLTDVSKVFTVFLMFVGGASGSTAGGIKVTTIGVVIIAVLSQVRGRSETIIFKKKVPHEVVMKSLSIVILSALILGTVTIILLAYQAPPLINTLFESASAFGTVGLSTGITPNLKLISKILIIITMFVGRIGPFTFAIALSLRTIKPQNDDIIYPDGKIVVG